MITAQQVIDAIGAALKVETRDKKLCQIFDEIPNCMNRDKIVEDLKYAESLGKYPNDPFAVAKLNSLYNKYKNNWYYNVSKPESIPSNQIVKLFQTNSIK